MKLFGTPISPFVRKVAITLKLKGLSFDIDPVIPGDESHEVFCALSPLRKIPAFADEDVGLADSTVICEYLEEKHPQVPVYPTSLAEKSRARWLEEYADTRLMEVCGPGIFFERVVKPNVLGQEPDEAAVEENIKNRMPPVLDYLEGQVLELVGQGNAMSDAESGFLFGALGISDISIGVQFLNARYAGFVIDSKQWPALDQYLLRVWRHPAFIEQIDQEKPMRDGLSITFDLAG